MAEKKQQMDLFAHFVYKVYSVLDMLEKYTQTHTDTHTKRNTWRYTHTHRNTNKQMEIHTKKHMEIHTQRNQLHTHTKRSLPVSWFSCQRDVSTVPSCLPQAHSRPAPITVIISSGCMYVCMRVCVCVCVEREGEYFRGWEVPHKYNVHLERFPWRLEA